VGIYGSNEICSSSSPLNYFVDRADVAGNLGRTEKTVLAYRNNRKMLRIPGLDNIFGPFFFEFSKGNVLTISLKE